jgi:mannose-6-phosphate isomerase-like protein (cupin superfamily)
MASTITTSPAFDALLAEVRRVHERHPATRAFCPFADDLEPQAMVPQHRPCADLMAREPAMEAGEFAPLRDAMLAVSPDALWRETYAGTGIGRDFMDRFACYCIIGSGGPWSSAQMAAYMVWMPAGFWYTWHHHPAEEMYLVVAGQGEFLRSGMPPETLGPGGTAFHDSNQPHALRTHDQPILTYVIWRNNLGIKPGLTPPERIVETPA